MTTAESHPEKSNQGESLTLQDLESALQHLAHIAMGGLERLATPGMPDRKEQAAATSETQDRLAGSMYRVLLEELPVVTFMAQFGADFNEIYVSPQIEAMLGYSQHEWLDNPVLWYERLHPEDKARWNVEFSRFLIQDEPFRSVYRFLARDGHVVWVRGEVKMIRDEHGEPICVQGIGFDITELKQADEALKRAHNELEERVEERTAQLSTANAALQEEVAERKRSQEELHRTELQLLHSAKLASLGTLATGVAHELNQPLAGIRAIAQQLLHGDELPQFCTEDLAMIVEQTQRMTKIINHLRTFARAPSDEVEIVDMNEVVQNCFILIGQQLKAHGIEVELALCKGPARVRADANELEQVVLNLVTNARDALEGHHDPRITLQSRSEETRVVLEVCDNGSGVPQDRVSRIFDPFFTTKEVGVGTGLGLSISFGIVTRYGGTLEYHTENGAVFTIILPLANV